MKFAEFVWSVDNILSTNVCLQESSDRPLEWFVILMGYAFWNHIHPVAGDINENCKQLLTTATNYVVCTGNTWVPEKPDW